MDVVADGSTKYVMNSTNEKYSDTMLWIPLASSSFLEKRRHVTWSAKATTMRKMSTNGALVTKMRRST